MRQVELRHQFFCRAFTVFPENRHDPFDLVADLIGSLVGPAKFGKGGIECFKHKFDEVRGAAFGVAVGQNFVIVGLTFPDDAFDREADEDFMPIGQNQTLPESPHPSVTIHERMDELEFVMEDAAFDQRVVFGVLQPIEQVVQKLRDSSGRGCDVDDSFSGGDTDGGGPEYAGFRNESVHQNPMGFQQIAEVNRVEAADVFVKFERVPDFLHFRGFSQNPFAVEYRRDLFEREGVVLDGQRGVDGSDFVGAAQQGIDGHGGGGKFPDPFHDCCHQGQNPRRDLKRWLFCVWIPGFHLNGRNENGAVAGTAEILGAAGAGKKLEGIFRAGGEGRRNPEDDPRGGVVRNLRNPDEGVGLGFGMDEESFVLLGVVEFEMFAEDLSVAADLEEFFVLIRNAAPKIPADGGMKFGRRDLHQSCVAFERFEHGRIKPHAEINIRTFLPFAILVRVTADVGGDDSESGKGDRFAPGAAGFDRLAEGQEDGRDVGRADGGAEVDNLFRKLGGRNPSPGGGDGDQFLLGFEFAQRRGAQMVTDRSGSGVFTHFLVPAG